MAGKRSIPTTLFESPDFFELSSNTTRLILVGIILDADDEGRGSAHPRLLARKLDQTPEDIEQALEELATHGILRCYTTADRSYYVLLHWQNYQVLSRPTASNYPPPPQDESASTADLPAAQNPQGDPELSRGIHEFPGNDTPEGEEEQKRREAEREEKRTENEGEALPHGTTRFPPPRSDNGSGIIPISRETSLEETKRVASLLTLPVSDQLETIVREFLSTPTISLIGEAIEARAWIDDARRNRRGQSMTPAFFRRWLKRERGDYASTVSSNPPTQSVSRPAQTAHPAAPTALSNRQGAVNPYEAYVLRRIAEVKENGYQPKEAAS
jgi:hypothetical protein